MPEHPEIREFAQALAGRTGYQYLDESEESKVCLLGRSNMDRFLPPLDGPTIGVG